MRLPTLTSDSFTLGPASTSQQTREIKKAQAELTEFFNDLFHDFPTQGPSP